MRAGRGQGLACLLPRADSPALSGAAHVLGFMLRACALRMPCSGSTSGRGLPDAESRPVPAANGGAGSRGAAVRASEDGKAVSGGVHAFSVSFMARSHWEACCPRSGSGRPPAEASHAVPAVCGAGGSSRGVSVPWVTMAISCSRRSSRPHSCPDRVKEPSRGGLSMTTANVAPSRELVSASADSVGTSCERERLRRPMRQRGSLRSKPV